MNNKDSLDNEIERLKKEIRHGLLKRSRNDLIITLIIILSIAWMLLFIT